MEEKIQSYFQLNVWKKAHQLTLNVYKATALFPQSEQFTLVDQLKRTASAITVGISDGFQRRNRQEKARLYIEAQNFLNEIYYLLILSKDLGYISSDELLENTNEIQRMLSGLIRSVLGINKNNPPRNRDNDTDGLIAGSDIDEVDML